jgi:hypothetical protein
MMKLKAQAVTLLALALLATAHASPRRRDPLTEAEITQIRDASWEPTQRLTLYVKFARARLAQLETMRADPKAKDRAQQTHDFLDDFQLIYDELNDNIETYVDRKDDIRKPLKVVIDADTEFQAKLRALRDAADASPAERQRYEFVLTTAIESVDNSNADHRKLADELEEGLKQKKSTGKEKP